MEMKNFQLAAVIEHLLKVFLANPFREQEVGNILDMLTTSEEQHSIDEQIKRLRKIKRLLRQ